MNSFVPKNIVRMAKVFANISDCRFRIGAVIWDNRRWGGAGHNDMRKTHPKANTPYKTVHAEFAAALVAGDEAIGASMYVHRLLKSGEQGLAKPCVHCCAMLKGYGLEHVYYSLDKIGIGEVMI